MLKRNEKATVNQTRHEIRESLLHYRNERVAFSFVRLQPLHFCLRSNVTPFYNYYGRVSRAFAIWMKFNKFAKILRCIIRVSKWEILIMNEIRNRDHSNMAALAEITLDAIFTLLQQAQQADIAALFNIDNSR